MIEAIQGYLPWSQNQPCRIDSPFQDLATAIVLTAVEDYKKAMRKLWKPNLAIEEKRKLILSKNELEAFFHSDWYEMLTDIDPDKLIYHSVQTAKAEERKAIEKRNLKIAKKRAKEIQESQKTINIMGGNGI